MKLTLALCTALAFVACDGDEDVAQTGDTVAASDTVSDPSPDTAVADACEALADECVKAQKGCAVDPDSGAAACVACPAGQHPVRPLGACQPIAGTPLRHDFGTFELQPGQELGSVCQSWVLDNDEPLWINAVELDNDGFYHHSNWFVVPEDHEGWPLTPWVDCYGDGFSEVGAALAGGVLYAQSTQVRFELQKFVPGAATYVAPRSRVIGATHLLNYSAEAQSPGLRMTLYAINEAEVTAPLAPAQFIYTDLAIPPNQTSYVETSCDLEAASQLLFDESLDMKVHYILGHYHALGHAFEVTVIGGPHDGEKLVDIGAFSESTFGRVFDPPLDLAGATGLAYRCGFDNVTDEVVRWGIGDQEMCEALLFLESDFAFVGRVGDTTEVRVEEGVEIHSGACDVIAFPFAQGGE